MRFNGVIRVDKCSSREYYCDYRIYDKLHHYQNFLIPLYGKKKKFLMYAEKIITTHQHY